MRVFARIFDFPNERGRLPVALWILIQAVALLALATVVRDHRPAPGRDPAAWERMGMFVEFTSIAPLAVLFTVVAVAGLHALDPDEDPARRAAECKTILKLFTAGVVLVQVELLTYGLWKGIWEMFGLMSAVAAADLVLVFVVVRYLDSGAAS